MYTVMLETRFRAAHQVRHADGTLEPLHGHDWVIRAHFARQNLDANDMVVDFQQAQERLRSVAKELDHANLEEQPGIQGQNPTAEVVAAYLYARLRALGLTALRRVEVTEAPGCVAAYEPPTIRSPAQNSFVD